MTLTTSSTDSPHGVSKPGNAYGVAAGILGWTLDAFDFFVVVFLVDVLAEHFHVQKSAIIWTIMATLAMRPLGALVFGSMADRFGRRGALIGVVLYFSVIEVLCGLAPNYPAFLVLRALYGIGMGGYWGVGASMAMEHAPLRWRGLLSGILQGGYPIGYLLAAVASRFLFPAFGWRAMFWVGVIPALFTVYITSKAEEPEAWKQHKVPTLKAIFGVLFQHGKSFAYLLVLMTLMTCLSHGTQDLYPDFLKSAHGISSAVVANIAMIYNVGAFLGAISFGHLSETLGRRWSIITALGLSLLSIPAWAFGGSILSLILGSFVMQVGVQGAFGVIPVHMNEMSPDAVRSLFPGFVYQLGVLIASPTNSIEYALQRRIGYSWALCCFEITVIVLLAIVLMLGSERKGRSFLRIA